MFIALEPSRSITLIYRPGSPLRNRYERIANAISQVIQPILIKIRRCYGRHSCNSKARRALVNLRLTNLVRKSFSNLSLREVAREAGIAPTSFYRHFRDMDELGLEMVDEAGLMLRQLMRQARKRIANGGSVIAISVETFLNLSPTARTLFRLLLRESSGTSQSFRTAAAREIKHFIDELAEYIAGKITYPPHIAYIQSEGIVTLVFTAGAHALDMDKEREHLKNRVILQLKMLAKGADYAVHKEWGLAIKQMIGGNLSSEDEIALSEINKSNCSIFPI